MRRAIVAILVLFLLGAVVSPVFAIGNGLLSLDYSGGATCDATSMIIPLAVTSDFASPTPFTEVITLNGTTIDSHSGVQSGGHLSYAGVFGGTFTTQTFPYTVHDTATFPTFSVNIQGVCNASGSEPVVTIWFSGGSGSFDGPSVPSGYVQRTITCDTAVFDVPGGSAVGDNRIKAGQTWFVNPTPKEDASGRSWTQVYVSGYTNPWIWTSCVGPAPAGFGQ